MAAAQERTPNQKAVWPVFVCCLPALGGFVLFLLSFPIDRVVPFWPHLNLAEIFTLWFLFVTPITTVIATVALIKHKRSEQIAAFSKILAWTTIAVCVLVNAFILVGMWASMY